ncbi:ribonuclease Z [Facklamia miroungae]|uniref:Ribonuclease Z n=1 Tax=Facklamia miroungae TaxID=120956 RepID=A0A1G7R251_9LACT|nr:ribonuclease Z [Facklamia miroungae]NKZ29154.1 ribonuclease Z [Facklamia miroungae]SDG04807.1 ribonuclease Z [Facklamia miroungae]
MKLHFLGTGAGIPSRQRNVSSLALKLLDELNEVWLFDCGEATQHQILETTIRPRKINKIFITHLHGDHIFGLPGLLSSRSFQGGVDCLEIYGPQGIRDYIQGALKHSKSKLSYPLKINELADQGGELTFDNGWQVKYLPLDHGILSFGFRIEEPDLPGQLLVEDLAKFNIPSGPIFGQLKRGERVQLEDGTWLDGQDFLAPDRPGRVVTILGDTRFCQNSKRLAKHANALVHEATHEASEGKMARAYFHSTTHQAAQVAKDSQAKVLYLNHISARYLGKALYQLEKEAASIFEKSHLVNDFDEFEIPLN